MSADGGNMVSGHSCREQLQFFITVGFMQKTAGVHSKSVKEYNHLF